MSKKRTSIVNPLPCRPPFVKATCTIYDYNTYALPIRTVTPAEWQRLLRNGQSPAHMAPDDRSAATTTDGHS